MLHFDEFLKNLAHLNLVSFVSYVFGVTQETYLIVMLQNVSEISLICDILTNFWKIWQTETWSMSFVRPLWRDSNEKALVHTKISFKIIYRCCKVQGNFVTCHVSMSMCAQEQSQITWDFLNVLISSFLICTTRFLNSLLWQRGQLDV